MGLFFHQQESHDTKHGVKYWVNESSITQNISIEGQFYQANSQKSTSVKLFYANDQYIYCKQQQHLKSLKLSLTVIEQKFYLDNHEKVYGIKLMKKGLITTIITYNQTQFIKFYTYLSKYCILKNFNKHFIIQNLLGIGTFCKVYKGRNILNSSQVALKVVVKQQLLKIKIGRQILINQIKNLYYLKKYHLSPLIQIYQTDDCIILVFYKAQAGNMIDYITQQHNYNADLIKSIMKKVLENLKQIHALGIIHRDIKPQNILFTNNSLRSSIFLADFGLSVKINQLEDNLIARICSGTIGFIAPQVLSQNSYDQKCDIFSIGCLFYFLLAGRALYSRQQIENNQSSRNFLNKDYINSKIISLQNIDQIGRQFLRKLLEINPYKRISTKQALQNIYFQKQQPFKPWINQQNNTIQEYIELRIKKYWNSK